MPVEGTLGSAQGARERSHRDPAWIWHRTAQFCSPSSPSFWTQPAGSPQHRSGTPQAQGQTSSIPDGGRLCFRARRAGAYSQP